MHPLFCNVCYLSDKRTLYLYYIVKVFAIRQVVFWLLIVTDGDKRTLCLYFIVTLVISTRSVLYLNVTLVISAYYFCTSLLR